MKLHHLHLRGLTPYLDAQLVHERLVRTLLAYKASASSTSGTSIVNNTTQRQPQPNPTILTFTPPPTYTCGRREVNRLTASQIAHLRANGTAEFHEALRGGQTTYHGPGQMVGYLVADLQRHNLSARSYVSLLEDSVISTCSKLGVEAFRTEDPGVWTRRSEGREKICALGVHLRRNVSAHGIGFNVDEKVMPWFGRIVACGLEGKEATCLEKEGIDLKGLTDRGNAVEGLSAMWVDEVVSRLENVDAIESLRECDVLWDSED